MSSFSRATEKAGRPPPGMRQFMERSDVALEQPFGSLALLEALESG
jgi:hypothetical protein